MPRPLSHAVPLVVASAVLASTACTVVYHRNDDPSELPQATVRPGISGLLRDSISIVAGKRVGLLTNTSAVDEHGTTDIDLLRTDRRATQANVHLVELFSPEHGLNVSEDRPGIPSGTDQRSGLPVISLYGSTTDAPPDSAVAAVDVLVIDLPGVGSRTWTYDGATVNMLRTAARVHRPVVVLDRPDPITGSIVEGPMLDSALSSAGDPTHPGIAWALYPIPLRHGMTAGELARFYNAVLHIGADLHVVPARGWTREVWLDRTNLPFRTPSPSLRSLQSVILYTGLVPFEATNLSVGRGTPEAFQRIGAPWLDADRLVTAFKERPVRGVRVDREDFTPTAPGDRKYGGQTIHGVRFTITDRNALQDSRLCAALLANIHRLHPGQLTIDTLRFDRLWGSSAARQAILRGQDPDAVVDQTYGPAYAFRERVRPYLLY